MSRYFYFPMLTHNILALDLDASQNNVLQANSQMTLTDNNVLCACTPRSRGNCNQQVQCPWAEENSEGLWCLCNTCKQRTSQKAKRHSLPMLDPQRAIVCSTQFQPLSLALLLPFSLSPFTPLQALPPPFPLPPSNTDVLLIVKPLKHPAVAACQLFLHLLSKVSHSMLIQKKDSQCFPQVTGHKVELVSKQVSIASLCNCTGKLGREHKSAFLHSRLSVLKMIARL